MELNEMEKKMLFQAEGDCQAKVLNKKASFRATENTRRVLHFRWHRDII